MIQSLSVEAKKARKALDVVSKIRSTSDPTTTLLYPNAVGRQRDLAQAWTRFLPVDQDLTLEGYVHREGETGVGRFVDFQGSIAQ